MNKPKPVKRKAILNYHSIINYIEEKYDIRTEDYGGYYTHINNAVSTATEMFDDNSWYETSPSNYTPNQKLQHDKYMELCQNAPPHLSLWGWMTDHDFCEIHNGCDAYWNISYIIQETDENYSPPWIKEITQLVYDEFKDDLDKDGGLEVHISW